MRYQKLGPRMHIFKDPTFPLACMQIRDHGNSDQLHGHSFHELVVILAGRGRHMTNTGAYDIQAGDVFLLRGDMVHGYADTDQMTLVNILFYPRRLRLPLHHLRDLPGYHALFRVEPKLRALDRFQNRLRLQESSLTEVSAMIHRLKEELDHRRPGYRFQACAHLMTLIAHLSRCYTAPNPSTGTRSVLRLGTVLSHIEQHYREPITVQQLTRLAGMSESSLTRTFRRILNRSPMAHVIHTRIMHASELLQQDNVRITEAAFECGFTDSNYFSRQFRAVTGLSPRDFRARQHHPTP